MRAGWLVLLLFAAQVVNAENEVSRTVMHENPEQSTFVKHLYLDDFTTYHGPALQSLGSPHSVNNRGRIDTNSSVNFDNELTSAYLLNIDKGIGIGPDIPFVVQDTVDQKFRIGDVGLKAFDKQTIATPNFRLYTNLYLQAPTSADSQLRHMHFAVKSTPFTWWDIPDTRFRLGAWSELKYYDHVDTDKVWKAYLGPYVRYAITEKFKANLEYDMEAHNNVGDKAWQFRNYSTDVQPGFVYDINPTTSINPYVQFFTSTPVAMDTTSVGVNFFTIIK